MLEAVEHDLAVRVVVPPVRTCVARAWVSTRTACAPLGPEHYESNFQADKHPSRIDPTLGAHTVYRVLSLLSNAHPDERSVTYNNAVGAVLPESSRWYKSSSDFARLVRAVVSVTGHGQTPDPSTASCRERQWPARSERN